MRIAVDADVLGRQRTGDETYMRELLQGLAMVDQRNTYQVWLRDPQWLSQHLQTRQFTPIIIGQPSVWLRLPLFQPLVLRRHPVDVLHVQYVAPPTATPIVVTVHDISFESYPAFFSQRDLILFKTFVPFTVRRAAYVITCSQYTKSDIVKRYGISPDRVVVTYYGVDQRFSAVDRKQARATIQARYPRLEHFILFVGTLQPRKNVVRLVEAFHWLRTHSNVSHRLVIVGKQKFLYETIEAMVRRHGLENEVVFTGHVPEDDLLAFYGAADLLTFPSLFEGFGFPPLEAMACGTPVVCSNATSLPEIMDDAALLVDPYDPIAMGQAMLKALTMSDLRRELIAKGRERARMFNWQATAQQTLEVYEAAAQKGVANRSRR